MKRKAKRPRKAPSPVLALRIRKPLMAKIKRAARSEDRSLSEEAAARLDESFQLRSLRYTIRQVVEESSFDNSARFYLDFSAVSLDLSTMSFVFGLGGQQRSIPVQEFIGSAISRIGVITNPTMALDSADRLGDLINEFDQIRTLLVDRAEALKSKPPQETDIVVPTMAMVMGS